MPNWTDYLISIGHHPDDLQAGAILDPPDPDGRGYGNVTEVKPDKPAKKKTRKTSKKTREESELEQLFDSYWRIWGNHKFAYEKEFEFGQFANSRGDRVFIEQRLIVEIDGMTGKGGHPGAHRSYFGYGDDRLRDRQAALEGWEVWRIPGYELRSGHERYRAKDTIQDLNRRLEQIASASGGATGENDA